MTNFTIAGFFKDQPKSKKLFSLVKAYMARLGPADIVVARTQIAFRLKRNFAIVWLPQTWIRDQHPGSITLAVLMHREITDERIKQVVEPNPGRFTHHIVIEKPSDFNPDVKKWLAEAYESAK